MTQSVLLVDSIYAPTQEKLESLYSVHKLWQADDQSAFLNQFAAEVKAIATHGSAGASFELMRQLPNLEVVSVFGVGVDAVDLDYCKANGIRVGNTPDVLTDDVADLALGLCLATYRQMPFSHQYACQGLWAKNGPAPLTTKFSGVRVGIVGLGRIGLAIAKRLEGFDCSISYFNRNERTDVDYAYFSDLNTLADAVDCLIVALSPAPDMAGIIGEEVFDLLGPAGRLVNISRGFVVDEVALAKAIHSGRLAGAGLDVFANEPMINAGLLNLPNVVLQPHVASGTMQTRAAMGELMLENLANYFKGDELTAFVA